MAKPIKDTPVLTGDDAVKFTLDSLHVEPATKEEQEQNRAFAYQQEVDTITSHIQRLRDEEQTPEIEAEIQALIEERALKVEEIKQRYPYPPFRCYNVPNDF